MPSQPRRLVSRLVSDRSLDRRHLLVQGQDVGQGPDGGDAERVDLGVAPGVVPLDVLELGRVFEGGHGPVEGAHPLVQVRVAGANVADVALEVLHVDGLLSIRTGLVTFRPCVSLGGGM